jgi:hypothetical protein
MSIFSASRRRVNRQETNPLDKSTIVSIYPRDINETKPTIQPSTYHIPAGTYEKPSLLVIGSASWFKELDMEQPLLEIPVSSVIVADSIVNDYCNGLLGCNMGTHMPGLFFVPGEITVPKLIKEHQGLLDKARERQNNWYVSLTKQADSLWARTSGNPLAIDDTMRLAARELKLDKPWLKDFQLAQMIACVACGNLRNPVYPICPHCKNVIDKAKAKELNLVFAE